MTHSQYEEVSGGIVILSECLFLSKYVSITDKRVAMLPTQLVFSSNVESLQE